MFHFRDDTLIISKITQPNSLKYFVFNKEKLCITQ